MHDEDNDGRDGSEIRPRTASSGAASATRRGAAR
jgi:hypothetical protein